MMTLLVSGHSNESCLVLEFAWRMLGRLLLAAETHDSSRIGLEELVSELLKVSQVDCDGFLA